MRRIKFLLFIIFIFFIFLAGYKLSENLQDKKNIEQTINLKSIKQEIKQEKKEEIKLIEENKAQESEKSNIEIQKKLENINNNKIEYYKVIRIIDGDTIVVDIEGANEKIRLIGIDTPETNDSRKPVECFGVEASKKAQELLGDKLVFLEKDTTQAERDKYNRLLRYVKTKNGLFYNLEIIKQGYAHEYTYIIPYKYQREFKEAENYAQTNKLGLWADDACSK